MSDIQSFNTKTALAEGLKELFQQLEKRLALTKPVNVYLAGGMAVYLYAASRVTTDVDAEFGARLYLPDDLMVEVTLEDGTPQVVYLDTNYNSTFALMHENYQSSSIPVDFGIEHIHVRVLSPVDLAVSKIARFADNDKADIQALVRRGLTTADEIEERANDALIGFIGGQAMLLANLRDAVKLAKEAEQYRQRLEALHLLQKKAGAPFAFWRNAMAAIKNANDRNEVDWAAVEQKTILESIGEHGQPPEDVAQALCDYSPGAVSAARQQELRQEVLKQSLRLQQRNDVSDSGPTLGH